MPAPANQVSETSTTTGTGNFTVAAANGASRFSTAFGTGGTDVFDYYISNRDAAEWERGTGHMSDANTLVRDTVIESTNANAAVNFSAGTKDVSNDVPALSQWSMPRAFNVLCPHEGLIVKYISATVVDVDATAVTLFHSNGNSRRFTSLNESPAITASGANGLDTGSEASSIWYHIWPIAKEDGTLDTLLSTSSSAPTMPAGYTYKGYVGAVRNDGSSNFKKFLQRGIFVYTPQDDNTVLTAGTATSYTSVDASAAVPPTATALDTAVLLSTSAGTANCGCQLSSNGSGATPTTDSREVAFPGLSTSVFTPQVSGVPMSTAQTIYYKVEGTNAQVTLRVSGWRY